MLTGQFRWFFLYVLPPLLGAVIGYLTNALAIRMLFRPLEEKRLGRFRLPFTPGIIPKYRHQLAENIGDMVSRELLSQEILLGYLRSGSFRDQVRERVSSWTSVLLKRKLGTFIPLLKQGTRLLSDEKHTLFLKNLKELLLSSGAASMPLNRLIPLRIGETGALFLGTLYPMLMEALLEGLKNPATRENLAEQGISLVDGIQKKMNFFQKAVMTAGRYDKTLKNRMPDIIEDVIEYLEEFVEKDENRDTIIASISGGLEQWSEKSIQELFDKSGMEWEKIAALADTGKTLFSLRHSTLGELFIPDTGWKNRLDDWVVQFGLDQLAQRLDSLLALADIRTLVVERIDSLSIEEVEKLLLSIIRNICHGSIFSGLFWGSYRRFPDSPETDRLTEQDRCC